MKKRNLIILFFFLSLYTYSQRWETGFVYSPFCVNKLTFDKDYVIFNNYTSLAVDNKKAHHYFTLFSTGVFTRYKWRNLYVQAEINLFENKFKKQLPGWKSINDEYFSYSDAEIPLLFGLTINPGSILKVKVFAGINNKIERFKVVYFSTAVNNNTFNSSLNSGNYPDAEQKKEMMDKFSPYFADAVGGIGFIYYGTSVDLRVEKNITNLNKVQYENNANYSQLMLIRLCFTFNFYKF